MTRAILCAAIAAISACALDTGSQSVEIDLAVAGTDVGAEFEGRDGARIALERADLAFGPLYLCRGAQAGELCETAALEWTESVVVDALDAAAREAGTLLGTEGRVRSFMYDLGLHSVLARQTPLVLPAARDLGGSSVVLVGQADQGGRTFPFRFEVAVAQGPDTTQGVPVVVSSEQDRFDEDIDAATQGLTVEFDPRPWLENVRFGAFVDDRSCADAEPPTHVCAGDVWQTCDGTGGVTDEADCVDGDQVCVVDEGCRDAFSAPRGSQAWRAVRNALVTERRARLRWSRAR